MWSTTLFSWTTIPSLKDSKEWILVLKQWLNMIYGVIALMYDSMPCSCRAKDWLFPLPAYSCKALHRAERRTVLQCARPTRGRWPIAHRSRRHDLARHRCSGYSPTGRVECPRHHNSYRYSGTVNTVSLCDFRGALHHANNELLTLLFLKSTKLKMSCTLSCFIPIAKDNKPAV